MAQTCRADKHARAMVARGIDTGAAEQVRMRQRQDERGHFFAKTGANFFARQCAEGKSAAALSMTECHPPVARSTFWQDVKEGRSPPQKSLDRATPPGRLKAFAGILKSLETGARVNPMAVRAKGGYDV